MKHLISLSLKYIRRQKLCSLMTFLCLVISVFILSSIAAYTSSAFTTLKNQIIAEDGSWEVDLSGLFSPYMNDKEAENNGRINDIVKASDILSHHAAVDDMKLTTYDYIGATDVGTEFEIAFNGENERRFECVLFHSNQGNSLLDATFNDSVLEISGNEPETAADGGAYLPEFIHSELGYNVGDRITLTVTAVIGSYDLDDEKVKAFIEELRRINNDPNDSRAYIITNVFEEEEQTQVSEKYYSGEKTQLITASLAELMKMLSEDESSEISLVEFERFGNVSFEYTIEGFLPYSYMNIVHSAGDTDGIRELIDMAEGCDSLNSYSEAACLLRINDSMDFDDSVKRIVNDLGLDYNRLAPSAIKYNSELLSFELKGADAISGLVIYIVIASVLLIIAWFFVRFIIDNAFEISVSERSKQFAALRVMGASKAQLAALILTEAVFYSITAVPIGILLAAVSCRSVFEMFRSGGLFVAEFSMKPMFALLGALLSVAAIFISAFTSAMWAARKLSPAEAMNFGKPSSKKPRKKRSRSRLERRSAGTVLHYTFRNIFSKKSRFVVVSAAIGLGTMLFTTSILAGIYIKGNVKDIVGGRTYDYIMGTTECGEMADFRETFGNDTDFSEAYAVLRSIVTLESGKDYDTMKIFSDFAANEDITGKHIVIYSVERAGYEKDIEPITGMSYDEFAESKGAFAWISPFGADYEEGTGKRVHEDFYKPASEFGFNEIPTVELAYHKNGLRVLGELCCDNGNSRPMLIIPESNIEWLTEGTNGIHEIELVLNVRNEKSAASAQEKANNFFVTHSMGYMENNYLGGTGFKTLVRAMAMIVVTLVLSIWLAGVFSMVSIVNTSVMNRSSELMMLRSVGMTRRQLSGSVVLESMLFSLFSTIIGIIAGIMLFCAGAAFYSEGKRTFFDIMGDFAATEILIAAVVFVLSMAAAFLAALPASHTLKKRIL